MSAVIEDFSSTSFYLMAAVVFDQMLLSSTSPLPSYSDETDGDYHT